MGREFDYEQPFMERLLVSARCLDLNNKGRTEMKTTTLIALSAAALIGVSPAVFAKTASTSKTPGHEMHMMGSKKGHHGASGYAAGREMQAKGSKASHAGASVYAPGQTTGANTKRSY